MAVVFAEHAPLGMRAQASRTQSRDLLFYSSLLDSMEPVLILCGYVKKKVPDTFNSRAF